MRCLPSRRRTWAGLVAWGLGTFFVWVGTIWPPALFAALGLLVASFLLVLPRLKPLRNEGRRPAAALSAVAPQAQRPPAPPPCRLLRPEDEAEVERLYLLLKTVGRLDSKSSADEM